MSYLIRLIIIASLIIGIFLIIASFEDKNSVLVENTSQAGVLFMNGLYQPGDTFCFTPQNGESYNIALVEGDSRQNIQVSKNNEINISSSEGENLGLKTSMISEQSLKEEDACQ